MSSTIVAQPDFHPSQAARPTKTIQGTTPGTTYPSVEQWRGKSINTHEVNPFTRTVTPRVNPNANTGTAVVASKVLNNAPGMTNSYNDLISNGTLNMNGVTQTLQPQTKGFMQALLPAFNGSMSQVQITSDISNNVRNWYKSQGMMDKVNGFKKADAAVVQDIAKINQYAQALKAQGDTIGAARYEYMAQVMNNVFQQARAEAQKEYQATKAKVGNFAKNNWWWMVPGGLIAASRLFGGGAGQEAATAQARPQDPFQTRPAGWDGTYNEGLELA